MQTWQGSTVNAGSPCRLAFLLVLASSRLGVAVSRPEDTVPHNSKRPNQCQCIATTPSDMVRMLWLFDSQPVRSMPLCRICFGRWKVTVFFSLRTM